MENNRSTGKLVYQKPELKSLDLSDFIQAAAAPGDDGFSGGLIGS